MLIIRLMWLIGGVVAVARGTGLGEEEEEEDESAGGGGVGGGGAGGGGGGGTSPAHLLRDEVTVDQAPATPPIKIWINPRKSVLRPKKRDLHEDELLLVLGASYDPGWMRTTRPPRPGYIDINDTASRVAVKRLVESLNVSPPWGASTASLLAADTRRVLSDWLLEMATCPLRYVWKDLGPDFWPRWLKTGQCPTGSGKTKSCSWPPGMSCIPGPHKQLHVLRWHCRLRKGPKRKKNDNNVWGADKREDNEHHNNSGNGGGGGGGGGKKDGKGGGRKRSRYRCLWIKVPYPVAEDCMCSC